MANFLQQLVSVTSSGTVITVAAFHCTSASFNFMTATFFKILSTKSYDPLVQRSLEDEGYLCAVFEERVLLSESGSTV